MRHGLNFRISHGVQTVFLESLVVEGHHAIPFRRDLVVGILQGVRQQIIPELNKLLPWRRIGPRSVDRHRYHLLDQAIRTTLRKDVELPLLNVTVDARVLTKITFICWLTTVVFSKNALILKSLFAGTDASWQIEGVDHVVKSVDV